MIREEESNGEREKERQKVDKLDPDEKFWIHKFARVRDEEGAIAQELETC